MPASYTKRIAKIGEVSVYATMVDSQPRNFTLVRARRTIAQYSSRDAALRAAERAAAGEESAKHTDELIMERARSLKPSEPLEGGLDIRLLAALEVLRLERETSSTSRADLARLVGNLLAESGDIPTSLSELEDWIAGALAKVTGKGNRSIVSRSALTARLQTMVRVVRQIESRPVVFRRWLHVPGIVKERTAAHKRGTRSEFDSEVNHEPFSKSDVISMVGLSESFAETLSLLIYLTGGFRAVEGENVSLKHITHDGLVNLSGIVTKTKVNRKPPASVLLRAALKWFDEHPVESRTMPEGAPRRRFRPTAAVHLILAGLTQLEVMEKLGHSTLAMVTNHYAKLVPLDFAKAKSAAHYFGVSELRVDGHVVPGNMWDWFLLMQALSAAQRWGVTDFRPLVVELIKPVNQGEDPAPVVNL